MTLPATLGLGGAQPAALDGGRVPTSASSRSAAWACAQPLAARWTRSGTPSLSAISVSSGIATPSAGA